MNGQADDRFVKLLLSAPYSAFRSGVFFFFFYFKSISRAVENVFIQLFSYWRWTMVECWPSICRHFHASGIESYWTAIERERSIDHGVSRSVKYSPPPFGYHFFTPFLDRWSGADHVSKRSNRRLLPSGRTVVSGWGGEWGVVVVLPRAAVRQHLCCWNLIEKLLNCSCRRLKRAQSTYTAAASAHSQGCSIDDRNCDDDGGSWWAQTQASIAHPLWLIISSNGIGIFSTSQSDDLYLPPREEEKKSPFISISFWLFCMEIGIHPFVYSDNREKRP